jgi:hypothetical protein
MRSARVIPRLMNMIKTGRDSRPTDFGNQIRYRAMVAMNYDKENADHPWNMNSETHVTSESSL